MRTATFIRHAQSAANAGEVTEDVSQIGLTPCGRVEALKLASSFSEPPTLIVVSPFLRTRLTAQPTIYRVPDVPVEEWPVQEFTYLEPSRWNGTSPAERRPVVAEWWAKAGPGYRAGTGSESFSDLLRRARNTLERLERLPERNRVFVFTHGQFMQALRLLRSFPGTRIKHKWRGSGILIVNTQSRILRFFLSVWIDGRLGSSCTGAAALARCERTRRWRTDRRSRCSKTWSESWLGEKVNSTGCPWRNRTGWRRNMLFYAKKNCITRRGDLDLCRHLKQWREE